MAGNKVSGQTSDSSDRPFQEIKSKKNSACPDIEYLQRCLMLKAVIVCPPY